MNNKTIVAASAIGLTAAATCGFLPAAHAAPFTSSHMEYLSIIATTATGPASVVAHGAFAAGGTDTPGDRIDLLTFPGGTIKVNHGNGGHDHQSLNKKTCYIASTETGRYTLQSGTGDYSTISGHGTYRATFDGVFPKKSNGSCNLQGEPTASQEVIKAKGPITGTVGRS